jgi:mono/diheme cytochrome c family protein
MTRVLSALLLAFGLTVAATAGGGQVRQDFPLLELDSLVGQEAFDRHCAACHGTDGRGQGPVTEALRSRPPDLTTLARRSGGVFPREELAGYIAGTGREVPAHGTGDMPVWGPIFQAFDRSEVHTRVRIQNLVAYVESLQVPPDVPPPAPPSPVQQGAELFRAYCGSCHGPDGRGAGPVSEALRTIPPDLTEFTLRNAGVFPDERVRQIIDGRHVTAHGTTEMPVWGRVFIREPGGDPDVARARIEALVRYLESIQQRRL